MLMAATLAGCADETAPVDATDTATQPDDGDDQRRRADLGDAAGDAADSLDVAESGSLDSPPDLEPDVALAPDVPHADEPDLAASPVVFVGAGDIAECTALGYAGLVRDPHELTADLVLAYPEDTPVFTLGDHAYSDGSAVQFATCYDKGWGQFRERTFPTPGNHDYNTDDAEGYFDYFGSQAGPYGRGYYSFDVGEWHAVSLNSNCGDVACDAESEQIAWLERDLADNPTSCVLAMWHHPRFSSDRAGSSTAMQPAYQVLYDAGADLILVGHAHNYERLAPLTPVGEPDDQRGIRQLVVGTGGADLRELAELAPHSEVFASVFGILELTLYVDRYEWRFVSVDGDFEDSGSQPCHD
jgi:hypothetical protein